MCRSEPGLFRCWYRRYGVQQGLRGIRTGPIASTARGEPGGGAGGGRCFEIVVATARLLQSKPSLRSMKLFAGM
jgi:hypothetical protein